MTDSAECAPRSSSSRLAVVSEEINTRSRHPSKSPSLSFGTVGDVGHIFSFTFFTSCKTGMFSFPPPFNSTLIRPVGIHPSFVSENHPFPKHFGNINHQHCFKKKALLAFRMPGRFSAACPQPPPSHAGARGTAGAHVAPHTANRRRTGGRGRWIR